MCVVAPQRTAMPARRRMVLMGSAVRAASFRHGACVVSTGKWEYEADLSACNVSDEQLPRAVYRDENGELYDED